MQSEPFGKGKLKAPGRRLLGDLVLRPIDCVEYPFLCDQSLNCKEEGRQVSDMSFRMSKRTETHFITAGGMVEPHDRRR